MTDYTMMAATYNVVAEVFENNILLELFGYESS